MYCTVKEIIREVLDTDVPDSECVFAVVLTRGDVRHIAQDWSLTDDELETVMQRLDDAFEYGADVSVVHGVVRELMEEKRASRQVTVPAVMLEKVMALAGSEMKRLYAVGSENGGDGDAFVREEREAMDVVLPGNRPLTGCGDGELLPSSHIIWPAFPGMRGISCLPLQWRHRC